MTDDHSIAAALMACETSRQTYGSHPASEKNSMDQRTNDHIIFMVDVFLRYKRELAADSGKLNDI